MADGVAEVDDLQQRAREWIMQLPKETYWERLTPETLCKVEVRVPRLDEVVKLLGEIEPRQRLSLARVRAKLVAALHIVGEFDTSTGQAFGEVMSVKVLLREALELVGEGS